MLPLPPLNNWPQKQPQTTQYGFVLHRESPSEALALSRADERGATADMVKDARLHSPPPPLMSGMRARLLFGLGGG
jgi:hypothetical protein